MHRSLNKPLHDERSRKTTPIRSESCQKEYSCNTKTAISGSNYNAPEIAMTTSGINKVQRRPPGTPQIHPQTEAQGPPPARNPRAPNVRA